MSTNNSSWLKEAKKKFNSCAHNYKGRSCKLNGYPVLDCPTCKAYKQKKEN